MVQYILECIAFQLVFLIIYDVFLKRETFFQWNRFYLIGTYVLSMILPWVKIEAMKTTVPESFQAYPEFLWNMNDAIVVSDKAQETAFSISWEYTLLFGGMFLAALFFGYKLDQIYALRRKGEVQYFKDFTQIIILNSTIAFSFFKSIFLGDKVIEKEHQRIVQHELVHIRQKHSYDLMFFELMRIVGWFNPLVYVYQSRISELHEFIADAQVSKTHKKEQYQLLLSEVFQTQNISFINQFFKTSLIKKRIVMLQKTKSKKIWQLKYLLLLPLVFGMLAYTSLEIEQEKMEIDKLASSTEIIEVKDIENLSMREETRILKRLKSLSESSVNWELFVKDKNATMKFIPSTDGSYLSAPNGEKIFAKMAVDSKLSSKDQRLIQQFLRKHATNGSSVKGNAKTYNQLVQERQRLLQSSNEENPSIVNLDAQIQALKESINNSKSASVSIEERDTEEQYALLLSERDRLLKEMDEKNPVIVELDKQIKGLKNAMAQEIEAVPFFRVEQVPVFPGCENEGDARACFKKSMQRHISKNFRYPQEAQEKEIQGRVSVMFTMDKEGNITKIRTYGQNEILKAEVARIIELLPKMKPGAHKGKPVNVISNSIPIDFKLTNDDSKSPQPSFESGVDVPFSLVDEAPIFPGCEEDENKRACFNKMMQTHISKNFNYPIEAQEKGIQGRVSILFVISKEGTIKHLRMRGPDPLLEKEAARIIGLLPKMMPGKQKGKVVNVPFSIPITFKLQDDVKNIEVPKLGLSFGVDPIYFIDGQESSKEKLAMINPDDIESMSVLKGEAAKQVYGEKGKNGVVQVITKKKE